MSSGISSGIDPSRATPDDPRFAVRRMTLGDVETSLAWAAEEGWNPGLDDACVFFAADDQGFFMGTWNGAPIGCISAVAYGDAFGFIGLYTVRPEWRGKGFACTCGTKAWPISVRATSGSTVCSGRAQLSEIGFRARVSQRALRGRRVPG